jgi:hypothetical protein
MTPPERAPTKPVFLITIDTEGDDVWSRPRRVETQNARFLPRFQNLCERFNFIPTYLTNREMALEPAFVEMARDAFRRGAAEIGMHMHCWDSPPIEPLGEDDCFDQPYAPEYAPDLIDRKAELMTRLLEDVFDCAIRSHRAGRWGFCASYARSLIRLGYEIDCSVTPGVNWASTPGFRRGKGGVDYTSFPTTPYWLDPDDISRAGRSPLLEAPMTIVPQKRPWPRELARQLIGRRGPRLVWLRPEPGNLDALLTLVALERAQGKEYVQFTLHSSELMPGGSPTFPTRESIEALYRDLEILFAAIAENFSGYSLADYARAKAVERQMSFSLST